MTEVFWQMEVTYQTKWKQILQTLFYCDLAAKGIRYTNGLIYDRLHKIN